MVEQRSAQKLLHNVIMNNCEKLTLSGVRDVEGFDETKVYAMLEGMAFTVGGKGLKVVNFSSESGELRIEGEIDSVTYTSAISRRAGIFARIFR